MRILGVDPGATGALAMIDDLGDLRVADMPVFMVMRGKSDKAEVDVRALFDLLDEWRPDVAYFEQVGGMKGQAAGAAFNFGRSTGLAEAAVKRCSGRFIAISPASWKRRMGLLGAGKDASRSLAANTFSAYAALFRRAKDDGRAEAALLAEYGRRLELPAARIVTQDIFA
jgi:hypothetical protein